MPCIVESQAGAATIKISACKVLFRKLFLSHVCLFVREYKVKTGTDDRGRVYEHRENVGDRGHESDPNLKCTQGCIRVSHKCPISVFTEIVTSGRLRQQLFDTLEINPDVEKDQMIIT